MKEYTLCMYYTSDRAASRVVLEYIDTENCSIQMCCLVVHYLLYRIKQTHQYNDFVMNFILI